MANGTYYPQRNHTRWICGCILILGFGCIVGGCFLVWQGKSGEILFTGAVAAISGLTGLLSQSKSAAPPQDVTFTGDPPTVKLEQPKTEPAIE